jgi:hypothetical protein
MPTEHDWRIDNCKALHGAKLRRKEYRAPSKEWDHDHCAGCWATFMEIDAPDILHEGYATTVEYKLGEDYEWVCPTCFADLRAVMDWIEVV